jgi:hypothetical protein
VAALEKRFYEVSDPKHLDYGKHMTIDELTRALAPGGAPSKLAALKEWLASVPLQSLDIAPNQDLVHACMSHDAAAQLTGSRFSMYKHGACLFDILLAFALTACSRALRQALAQGDPRARCAVCGAGAYRLVAELHRRRQLAHSQL